MTAGSEPDETAGALVPADSDARSARPEIVLEGGVFNQGKVVRVGNRVHRPKSLASDAIRSLLAHLERVGFDGATRYLGEDEAGREVFTFVEGEAVTVPYPAWALTDSALASVAHLLRRYHEAVASFSPADHIWATNVPSRFRRGLVTHNDPNLDNIVFRSGRAVALIDFDLASPGSIAWDVGMAARLWVPLRDPVDVFDARKGDPGARLRTFLDAYGLRTTEERRLAVEAAVASHEWCYSIVAQQASRGRTGFVRFWTPQAREYSDRGRTWLASNREALLSVAAHR